jgi:hypothetical protein
MKTLAFFVLVATPLLAAAAEEFSTSTVILAPKAAAEKFPGAKCAP